MVSDDFSILGLFNFESLFLLDSFQEHLLGNFLHLQMNWNASFSCVMIIMVMSQHALFSLAGVLTLLHVPLAHHLVFLSKVELLGT